MRGFLEGWEEEFLEVDLRLEVRRDMILVFSRMLENAR